MGNVDLVLSFGAKYSKQPFLKFSEKLEEYNQL